MKYEKGDFIPLLAIAILLVFLLLISACAKPDAAFKLPNKTFVLDPAITYPEERNVLTAVPVIPVEIDSIK